MVMSGAADETDPDAYSLQERQRETMPRVFIPDHWMRWQTPFMKIMRWFGWPRAVHQAVCGCGILWDRKGVRVYQCNTHCRAFQLMAAIDRVVSDTQKQSPMGAWAISAETRKLVIGLTVGRAVLRRPSNGKK